jgi:hypothetical protein
MAEMLAAGTARAAVSANTDPDDAAADTLTPGCASPTGGRCSPDNSDGDGVAP